MKRKFTKFKTLVFILFALTNHSYAQQNFFKTILESNIKSSMQKRVIIPLKYRTLSLNTTAFKNFVSSIPFESTISSSPTLEIPMPDGTTANFLVWETSIMEPALSAKYPNIKTFRGKGVTDPTATLIFDWTEFGFHAMVLSPVTGSVFIDPYAQDDNQNYIAYFKKDFKKDILPELSPIDFRHDGARPSSVEVVPVGPCRGTQLFTYKLVVACTHQYAIAATGLATPTVAQVLAKIVTTVNRVTGVYEKEVAVRLILIVILTLH